MPADGSANLKPIKPGEVRNPNGHNQYIGPKAEAKHDILEAMETRFGGDKAEELVDTLAGLMRDESSQVVLGAVRDILDRMLGKPRQSMDIAGPADITITRKGEKTTVKLKPQDSNGNGHDDTEA